MSIGFFLSKISRYQSANINPAIFFNKKLINAPFIVKRTNLSKVYKNMRK